MKQRSRIKGLHHLFLIILRAVYLLADRVEVQPVAGAGLEQPLKLCAFLDAPAQPEAIARLVQRLSALALIIL
jgi:hypothetical protein